MEKANDELGNEKTSAQVNQLRSQVDRVIRNKDVNLVYEIKDQVHSLFFLLTLPYQLIGWIRHYNSNFGQYHWKDINRARTLMNQAINMINNQPRTEDLHPIVISLMELLPMEERKDPGTGLGGSHS